MNNDLISRSALLKEMNDYCGNQRYLIPENVWEMVENMPTAYDVDKVIEKISLLQDNAEYDDLNKFEEKAAYNTAYFDAIKVVKEEYERCGKPEGEG